MTDYDTACTDATILTIAFVAGDAALAVLLSLAAPAHRTAGLRWELVPTVGLTGGGIAFKRTL